MPDWKNEVEQRLASLRLSAARKASVAEELTQHLDDHYKELIAGGAPPDAALRTALHGLDRHELLRELRSAGLPDKSAPALAIAPNRSIVSGIWNDVRYTVRSLRKSPGFTAVAVLTIALGIAANTAIFTVLNSLFLHPPGVSDPDHLVALRVKYEKLNLKDIGVSLTDYADARDSRKIFSSSAAVQPGNFNYTGGAMPERLLGAQVTWQWFDTFGVRPLLGRAFVESEDLPGAEHEVILSYSTWQRLFGKDDAIIGKSILLNEQSYRVVGVMGQEFNWPSEAQLWVPLGVAPKEFGPQNRFNESYAAVARLAPGVSRQQGEAWVRVLSERVIATANDFGRYARDSRWGMFTESFSELVYGDLRTPMIVLSGTVGFVLLICCANVAGLMLARASGRGRELAIRTALGARRAHLVRQVLVESLLIAACGTGIGIALAGLAVRNASAIAPEGSIGNLTAPMDHTVLLFSISAGLLAALLFGIAPAWTIAGAKNFALLKEGGRSSTISKSRQRLRAALVMGEVALALVLLVGAGLFLKSLIRTQQISPGFDSGGVMTAAVSLDPRVYATPEKRQAFFLAVTQNLAAQPGVQKAGIMNGLPFSGMGGAASFSIEGRQEGPGDPGPHSDIAGVTPGMWQALSIPLRSGRYLTEEDRLGSEPVVVIDENLARQYWPGQDPVGARIRRGKEWTRIVGVVGHVKRSSLAADSGKGVTYYSLFQLSEPMGYLVARTPGNPASLAQTMREAVHAVDSSQAAVYDLKPLSERVAASLGPRRFAVTMLIAFAVMALFMAALGLYGVISYSVAQRTQEIGVRMALGARVAQVLWMVISQSMRLVLAGVVAGLLAAVVLARLLASELVQISAFDPLTFIFMCLVLIGVTLVAASLPARRAALIEPVVALRNE